MWKQIITSSSAGVFLTAEARCADFPFKKRIKKCNPRCKLPSFFLRLGGS